MMVVMVVAVWITIILFIIIITTTAILIMILSQAMISRNIFPIRFHPALDIIDMDITPHCSLDNLYCCGFGLLLMLMINLGQCCSPWFVPLF